MLMCVCVCVCVCMCAVYIYSDKVLAGGWDDVRSLLRQLRLDDAVAETTAIALVICQQMMEALEAGQVAEALALLRSELTPRATLTTTTTTAAPAAAAAGGEKGGGPARKVTRYVLKGEPLARETASKTDVIILSRPHNASSAPWSSTPSLQRSY